MGNGSRGQTEVKRPPAAGGHAPRVALDVGSGAEAGGGRLRGWCPRRKDPRGQCGVGGRVIQRAAGELVARSTEERVRAVLEDDPHGELPMQHLGQVSEGIR